jgi:hypothetical protein
MAFFIEAEKPPSQDALEQEQRRTNNYGNYGDSVELHSTCDRGELPL